MKQLLLKIFIFSLCLILAQLIVSKIFPIKIPDNIVFLKNIKTDSDIIGLGDSSFYITPTAETNKKSTYQILDNLIPGKTVKEITHPAYHIDIYKHYFTYIATHHQATKYVIIPINLRSFSPQWDMNPAYEFKKEQTFLTKNELIFSSFYRPLEIFKYFSPKAKKSDYENIPVFNQNKKIGKVKDFLTSNYKYLSQKFYKDKFIFHYMYDLKPNHHKLKSIKSIINFGERHNITPIFIIIPIDYENGNKFVGENFTSQIDKNSNLIVNIIKKENGLVLNLAITLTKNKFYWYRSQRDAYTPNEHLNFEGRNFVANKIYNFLIKNKVLK